MVKLTILECTADERARIGADMARVGATRFSREVAGGKPGDVSYYTLLIEHGLRAPCRPGACERTKRVYDEEHFYNWCRKCGTLKEEEKADGT